MGKKKSNEKSLPIKSDNLVVRIKANTDKNTQTITIKRYKNRKKDHVYLADVFKETPPGFIYKDETGMGATTLELQAKRNSIIVEPIRITASSKAYKHDALYVGSGTKYHQEKSIGNQQIKSYVTDATIEYKKILVVADSLYKVIDAIGENVYQDYFLLIDEIDSFQLDSTYRKSMEETLDYYKKFNIRNRAMLSATRIDFTDPILSTEPITFIKYDYPKTRKVNVITTSSHNHLGVSVDTINKLVVEFPNDKIFVAFNSVTGSLSLADHLLHGGNITKEQIKILCSRASSNIIADFYHELDSDVLPAKVNFFTSAYFTGFDLKEKYHLVSISGNSNAVQALSDRRLKQIAGRCRPGLLSETIIHDVYHSQETEQEISKESLLEAAKIQADAISCYKKHYSKSTVLKQVLFDLNARMLAFLESRNMRFIRNDIHGNSVISYLNIDAYLESLRVRNTLYTNKNALTDRLVSDGNTVTHKTVFSNTLVEKSNTFVSDRNTQIETIFNLLENADTKTSVANYMLLSELSSFQKFVINEYLKVYSFIEPKEMLNLMKKSLLNTRDNRKFNLLMQSAIFHINPKGNLAVDRLDFHFPVQNRKDISASKQKLTKKEIRQKMVIYLTELGNPAQNISEAKAIRLLNNLRMVYRKRDPKTKLDYYIITQANPLKIPITKQKDIYQEEDSLYAG